MYQISSPPVPSDEFVVSIVTLMLLSALAAVAVFNSRRKATGRRRQIAWAGCFCFLVAPPVLVACVRPDYGIWSASGLVIFLVIITTYGFNRRIQDRLLQRSHWFARAMSHLVSFVVVGLYYLTCLAAVAGCLMYPFVTGAREAANRTWCKSNLKQIGLAMHNFHDTFEAFPAAASGDPPHSWRVAILPFIDRRELFDEYDLTAPWDSDRNEPIAKTRVSTFQCPSRVEKNSPALIGDTKGRYYAHYSMLMGPHMAASGVSNKEITDGTSNTILAAEVCGLNIVWTEPRDVDTDKQPMAINLPSPNKGQSPGWLSSHHPGGAHIGLADGAVRFISDKIDPKLLRALSTVNEGESVGDF